MRINELLNHAAPSSFSHDDSTALSGKHTNVKESDDAYYWTDRNTGHRWMRNDEYKVNLTTGKEYNLDGTPVWGGKKASTKPSAPTARYYHDVPFSKKELAKAEGMRWDPVKKKWYHTSLASSNKSEFKALSLTEASKLVADWSAFDEMTNDEIKAELSNYTDQELIILLGDGDGESMPSTLLKLAKSELKKRRMPAVNEGLSYSEELAAKLPDGLTNADDILDAAFALAVKEQGKTRARYWFIVNEDFKDELVSSYLDRKKAVKVDEGAEPIPVQMSDLKIEEHDNDEWVTISVGPTAGNRVAFIKYLATDLYFKKYEVKSKTGKPFRFDTFKANGFAVKVEDRKALLTFIMRAINKFNTQIKKDLEHKQKAPERRKAAAIDYAAQCKITQNELKKKYGDAVNLVRTRQIGGDDGYQYNVLVRKDDRWVSIMNGLTQREADYYKNIEMENIAKKNGWGQYAKAD